MTLIERLRGWSRTSDGAEVRDGDPVGLIESIHEEPPELLCVVRPVDTTQSEW
jgi:hypothetical protein